MGEAAEYTKESPRQAIIKPSREKSAGRFTGDEETAYRHFIEGYRRRLDWLSRIDHRNR